VEVPKKIIIFTYFYRIVHSKPSSFGGKPHVFGCSPWPMAHGPQVSDEEFRSIVAERRSDWARTPGPPAETTRATWHVTRGPRNAIRLLGRILATLMVPWPGKAGSKGWLKSIVMAEEHCS
jgi:hypothetical protein